MLIAEIYHFTLKRPLVLDDNFLLCIFKWLHIRFTYFTRYIQ